MLQYRKGIFLQNCKCVYGAKWVQDHESCRTLKRAYCLIREERRAKAQAEEALTNPGRFTDVDFLLNMLKLWEAASILESVQDEI